MTNVLLLSMPFGALERQALGVSLLKAALERDGVPCAVRYPSFTFADAIGVDAYRWLSSELPYTAFAGDWLFTAALYGSDAGRDRAYAQAILRDTWHLDETAIARLFRLRQAVEPFLEHVLAALPWREATLVGFTSTFEQNIASLALARRMKAERPDLRIAFGGANWEGAMGEALHRRFGFVDFAFSGEADHSFPAFVRALRSGASTASIPGIVRRENGRTVPARPGEPVRDMDALPIPDYADYFSAFTESSAAAAVVPHLLLETSRGCWWGAKSHCTFCGLNGHGMAFRSKSGDRALAELRGLVARWGLEYVEVVDNILDMGYFRNVLPTLARERSPIRLFYEVKANLSRSQIRLLREAGVERIQPGIESLSDRVLTLMRKGTTGLQNIQLLKWCREFGVGVDWNVLYGFPGETRADYDAMLALLPSIRFLPPPTGWGPVRLDRFSPYFADPSAFGMTNVRPMAPYRFLYPFAGDDLAQIAYYFEYDYAPASDPSGAADEVVAYVQDWIRHPELGALVAVEQAEAVVLVDTRAAAVRREVTLRGLERDAYAFCDEARTPAAVVRMLQRLHPSTPFDMAAVTGFLDSLVANRLMLTDGARYLSLALGAAPPSERRQPSHAQPALA